VEIPNNSKETLEPISLKTNPDCNVALMHHHISQVVESVSHRDQTLPLQVEVKLPCLLDNLFSLDSDLSASLEEKTFKKNPDSVEMIHHAPHFNNQV
jgi:hypothetical protein